MGVAVTEAPLDAASLLLLVAGVLLLRQGRRRGDEPRRLVGAAAVVLGGLGHPLGHLTPALAARDDSLLVPMTAVVVTLVALSLLVRALNHPAAPQPAGRRPGEQALIGPAVVTVAALVVALAVLDRVAPSLMSSHGASGEVVAGALLSVACFSVGLEASLRGPGEPWAPRIALALALVSVAELLVVVEQLRPGGGEAARAVLLLAVAAMALHQALSGRGVGRPEVASVPQAPAEAARAAGHPPEPSRRLSAARRDEAGLLAPLFVRPRSGDTERFDVAEVVRRAVATHPGADLVVLVVAPGAVVTGRADDLVLALHHVLDNALEHGKPPVTVSWHVTGESVRVRVADQGPGPGPSLVPLLFDRGSRGPHSAGHGLGLHVARRLLRRHGGDLYLLSATGGAVFEASLPRTPRERGRSEASVPSPRSRRQAWDATTRSLRLGPPEPDAGPGRLALPHP